jgi:hypothetical protein
MKKTLVLVCLVMLSMQIFAQHFKSMSRSERMMSKSRERRRAGFIFLGAGAASTAAGLWLFDNGLKTDDPSSIVGFYMVAAGGCSMGISIPFFISAHHTRKKALSLSMKTENTSLLYKTGFSRQYYPALALQIPLGR